MDWNAAIDKHSEALKRIVVTLFAMAGLEARGQFFPQDTRRFKPWRRLKNPPCRVIYTAPFCGCCGRPNPPRGG